MLIPNNTVNCSHKTALTLSYLQASTFSFHATGSRYFGTYKSGSDYDFFALDSGEIRHFLICNGFRRLGGYWCQGNVAYQDTNTVHVYRNGNIDIQLVKDVEMKVWAQDMLKKTHFYSYMPKRSQRTMDTWNLLFRIYKELKKPQSPYVPNGDSNKPESVHLRSDINLVANILANHIAKTPGFNDVNILRGISRNTK